VDISPRKEVRIMKILDWLMENPKRALVAGLFLGGGITACAGILILVFVGG
jgi:hypothetical protein